MDYERAFSTVRFHKHNYEEDTEYLKSYDYWLLKEIEYFKKTGKITNEWERIHERYTYQNNNTLSHMLNNNYEEE